MAQLTFSEPVFLGTYLMFSSFSGDVDCPDYIFMVVFYRFISNFEVAIKDKEKQSSDLGKSLTREE